MVKIKKMAIICSTDYATWPTGGMLSFLMDIIPYLREYFSIDLWGVKTDITTSNIAEIKERKYSVNCIARVTSSGRKRIPNMLKVVVGMFLEKTNILKRNYDVLYFHGLPLELPFILLQGDKPLIFSHIHGLVKFSSSFSGFFGTKIVDIIYSKLRRMVMRKSHCTFISADTKTFGEFASSLDKDLMTRVIRIQNFADPELFELREKASIREKMGLPKRAKIIMFSGRFSYCKDPYLALSAAKFLLEENALKELLFLFAGKGKLLQSCEETSNRLGIANHVKFLGHRSRSELAKFLNASNAFLMTSRAEGTPVALIEALMCGLPVVTTAISGVRDIVVDGYNGFVANKRDPSEIARLLKEVLRREREMAQNSLNIANNLTPERAAVIVKDALTAFIS